MTVKAVISATIGLAATLATVGAGATGPVVAASNSECLWLIEPGDSLNEIIAQIAVEGVTVESVAAENGIADPDVINEGDLLDVCINGIDDFTGAAHDSAVEPPSIDPATLSGVEAQQARLNQLFAGYGLPELEVDGVSGPLTRQQLCAARLVLGLPISRDDMVPGSPEEAALMAAPAVAIPATAPVDGEHWALIDKTCQIFVAGEGVNGVRFVFTTSTGQAGYETRNQEGSVAFRYDPALDNGGWHDSSAYPAAADNPLNGNMYHPIYFDRGQAIHGANNVPPTPQSKGCARLHVENQDQLVAWLGLAGATGPVWDRHRVNLTVTVQGEFVAS